MVSANLVGVYMGLMFITASLQIHNRTVFELKMSCNFGQCICSLMWTSTSATNFTLPKLLCSACIAIDNSGHSQAIAGFFFFSNCCDLFRTAAVPVLWRRCCRLCLECGLAFTNVLSFCDNMLWPAKALLDIGL